MLKPGVFKLALVGKPNVGKSTLFNRLAGRSLALVHDQPGVTRDRREALSSRLGFELLIIDTAGYEDGKGDLQKRMRLQTLKAVEEADIILWVVDGREGISSLETTLGTHLRRANKPVLLIANKCEGRKRHHGLQESLTLGFGDPISLSAAHGDGFDELRHALHQTLHGLSPSLTQDTPEDENTERPWRLTILGRPNAGKSSLINTLIKEDRLLAGPEAGLTRDSIDVTWVWKGRKISLVDTAGLRKKARITEQLENLSTADTLKSLRFSDIALLVFDVRYALEKQDLALADLVLREGRGLVLVGTKADLLEDPARTKTELLSRAHNLLPQAYNAPLILLSGLTGENLEELMPAAGRVWRDWNAKVKTPDLNAWLHSMTAAHPPPARSGKRPKLRYIAQIKARPPTFVLHGSRLETLPESYKRYLLKGLCQAFDFQGVPLRLKTRSGDNPYASSGRRK